MNIYEQYGRLMEAYERECEAHRQTVGVLRSLKNDEITIEKIVVTNDNKWAITDDSPAN